MFRASGLLQSLLVSILVIGSGSAVAQPERSKAPKTNSENDATASQSQQKSQPRGQSSSGQNRSTLPDSVRRVERQTGGEVLRAEPMQRDGREVYRLKVLTSDGRVRVVQEDPRDHPTGSRSGRHDDNRTQKDNDNSASRDSDEDPSQN